MGASINTAEAALSGPSENLHLKSALTAWAIKIIRHSLNCKNLRIFK
jgi:hypothetical protein